MANSRILRDLRFAVRLLKNHRMFYVTSILTLALGIGPLIVVFGACNAMLLAPLRYKYADRLIFLQERNLTQAPKQTRLSYPDFVDLRDSSGSFARIAAYSPTVVTLDSEAGAERIPASVISQDSFSTLGVGPIIGQTFSTVRDDSHAVIIGQDLWQSRFGSDPAILGRVLELNNISFRVIGIMPAGFHLPFQREQMWLPLAPNPALSRARASHWLYVVGLLKSGVRLQQVQSELNVVSQRLQKQFPSSNHGWSFQGEILRRVMVKDVEPTLLLLLCAASLLLLVSCLNVGNLLIARATAREGEIGIRVALGASRFQLIQQMLTESFLLAVMASVVGLSVGMAGIRTLNAFVSPTLTSINPIQTDGRVLAFAIFISFLSVLIFGLVPTLRASKQELVALSDCGHGSSSGSRRRRLWSCLVVIQVCISFTVLLGASLLIRTITRLNNVNLGLNPENVLAAELSLPFAKYGGGIKEINAYHEVLEKIDGLPGIQSSGAISKLPIRDDVATVPISFSGQAFEPGKEEPRAEVNIVTPGALRTLGVPLVAGRELLRTDGMDAPRVALINQTFAQRYWPSENPLGKHLASQEVCTSTNPCDIVGIVGDIRSSGPQADPVPEVYVPLDQNWWGTMTLVIRTASSPLASVGSVRQAVWSVDKSVALARVQTMKDVISDAMAARRLSAITLSFIALLALTLSAVGIYGTISFFVNRQLREMGIRIALGASKPAIGRLVIGRGLRLAGTGIISGSIIAVLTMRLISPFLFGVSFTDPFSFLLVSLVLFVSAFIASYFPARQAMKLDLMNALRAE